jgi:hypothetical protein
VVADTYEQLSKYERLGIEVLQDPDSGSPECLLRALGSLSGVLDTEWAETEILAVKSRWRFVRGAIQQIYRALNRTLAEDRIDGPKLAAKVSGKIGFYSAPLYYATPGSLIDRAFQGVLPMIDADRVYERFVESVGVTQLAPGPALTESLHTIEVREAADLQGEICDKLAPFLIAPIIATGRRQMNSRRLLGDFGSPSRSVHARQLTLPSR